MQPAARRSWRSTRSSLALNRSRTMLARSLALIMLTLATIAGAQQPGPQMPDPQAMQMQVQRIMQERPREAEAAARAWLTNVAPNLIPALDSLKTESLDQYW